MYNYFKMMHECAGSFDVKSADSRDILVQLASRAGYYREMYTFKNGNVRERTFYRKSFDSVLTAKWMCYYEKMFVSHLNKYVRFGDKVIDIINSTFYGVMLSIDIDKIVNSKVADKYANMVLFSKIKAFQCKYCPISKDNDRYKKYFDNGKDRFQAETSSFTDMGENFNPDYCDDITGIITKLDFASQFKEGSIGDRLLEAMLETGREIPRSYVDIYIGMSRDECTERNKKRIVNAYNTICKKIYKEHKKCFTPIYPSSIRYSFEGV